jgi:hypothetical protein
MEKLLEIRFYGRRIAGVFIMLVSLILSVTMLKTLARDIPVWFLGSKTKATIVERWTDKYPDDSNPVYFLRYEFSSPDGEIVSGSSRVPGDEWVTYIEGSEIPVRYSNLNPLNNRLDDSRYVPFLFCSYIPFILICLFAMVLGKEMVE